MSDDWDADDFEPKAAEASGSAQATTDRWDGEDEEDVKDMWDADSAEEGDKEDGENVPKAIQRKKKKKLADIIAEKEAAEAAKTEARRLLKEAEREASTPAGKAAEKARLQKIEENANLQLAKDMLGLTVGSSVDKIVPVSKEDFDQLEKAIVDKVSSCNSSKDLTLFSDFVESLIKNLCLDLQAPALKKVKIHVEALHATRLKEEKANKAKKSKKGGQLRMDTTKDMFSGEAGGGYDDMDDFM